MASEMAASVGSVPWARVDRLPAAVAAAPIGSSFAASKGGFRAVVKKIEGVWLALAAVWLASIAMNEPVGGPGIGLLDMALALNRGLLGLLICYVLLPRQLARGRYVAFGFCVVAMAVAFGALHLFAIGPWIHAMNGVQIHCYRCYITQTLPTVATMAVVQLSWSLLEQQKCAALLARERSEAELRFLRTQMNPHLLMNSLNNVYSYALEKSERAPEMILKLSGVLRYMLYEASDGRVPLRRELDYIRDYVALQRLATEGRGDVRLHVEGDGGGWAIAPLLLIVPIENCFKHAIETIKPITIDISIRVANGMLILGDPAPSRCSLFAGNTRNIASSTANELQPIQR